MIVDVKIYHNVIYHMAITQVQCTYTKKNPVEPFIIGEHPYTAL